jgi:hypothetical protein
MMKFGRHYRPFCDVKPQNLLIIKPAFGIATMTQALFRFDQISNEKCDAQSDI